WILYGRVVFDRSGATAPTRKVDLRVQIKSVKNTANQSRQITTTQTVVMVGPLAETLNAPLASSMTTVRPDSMLASESPVCITGRVTSNKAAPSTPPVASSQMPDRSACSSYVAHKPLNGPCSMTTSSVMSFVSRYWLSRFVSSVASEASKETAYTVVVSRTVVS